MTERLAADAPNMRRPGADLVKYYLDPDRHPVDEALRLVISLFTASGAKADGNGTTIVAFRTSQDIDLLIPALRDLAGELPAA